jgi:hypothetical protein
VAPPSPTQLAWRRRIESALRVAGPLLDLALAAGDRLSRALVRGEVEAPVPPRRLGAGPADRRA